MQKSDVVAIIKEVLQGSGNTPSSWAKETWDKAKTQGITDGTNPQGYVTREQCIVMMDRAKK